ncbi:hypothetical protein THAOC_00589, partial [Thalassiosira oceanica]
MPARAPSSRGLDGPDPPNLADARDEISVRAAEAITSLSEYSAYGKRIPNAKPAAACSFVFILAAAFDNIVSAFDNITGPSTRTLILSSRVSLAAPAASRTNDGGGSHLIACQYQETPRSGSPAFGPKSSPSERRALASTQYSHSKGCGGPADGLTVLFASLWLFKVQPVRGTSSTVGLAFISLSHGKVRQGPGPGHTRPHGPPPQREAPETIGRRSVFGPSDARSHTMNDAPGVDGDVEVCAHCGKQGSETVTLKHCTACRLVKYCGVDCQRAHRKRHKKACKQRAAELKDEQLYSQGHQRPEEDFCSICTLPIPLPMGEHLALNGCCMKTICIGCLFAARKRGIFDCPFCRTPLPETGNDADNMLAMIQARVAKKDPTAILSLGQKYFLGDLGLQKDMQKSMELWTEAAELGSLEA